MLTDIENRITYSGNGNATEFAYQFKILDRTDIKVLLTDADGEEKLLTKDYYVDVEKNVVRYPGYAVGAEVPESERPAVLPTGWKLTIYREVPVTQETDLPDQYPFNQVEAIGDKLTMIAQQLTDAASRSLKVNISKSADVDTTIPWVNGKSFRISDDGTKVELTEDPAKVLPTAQSLAAAAAKSESNAKAYMDTTKDLSENVNVFVPSVDADGTLTWTNKAGLANPAAVNVKGATGETGATGPQGAQGVQGLQGPAGSAATITIGSVTTSAPGTSANVTNSGTSSAAVLDFVLPKGKDGADGGVTVDEALSNTSVNPVQNRAVKAALDNRAVLDDTNTFTSPNTFDIIYMQKNVGSIRWYEGSQSVVVGHINAESYTGEANTAKKATKDGDGNVITTTYAKKSEVSNTTVDTTLSSTSTNPIANKTVYSALGGKLGKTETAYAATKATQDGEGNVITETYATKADISGVVKSVNGVQPDTNGNVSITVSGGSGVSTSTENTWTAQQNFQKMKFNFESYNAPRISGATDNPAASVAVYNVQGNFTLDMSVLAGLLSNGDATLFTAYITSNGAYALSINNAGTLKYVGSASNLAITANGLLLNIMLIKSSSGDVSSVVQASTLA